MQSKQTKEKKKRVYEKPRLRTIELAAEEVLAVGCKLSSPSQPNVGDPSACGIGNGCVAEGS